MMFGPALRGEGEIKRKAGCSNDLRSPGVTHRSMGDSLSARRAGIQQDRERVRVPQERMRGSIIPGYLPNCQDRSSAKMAGSECIHFDYEVYSF